MQCHWGHALDPTTMTAVLAILSKLEFTILSIQSILVLQELVGWMIFWGLFHLPTTMITSWLFGHTAFDCVTESALAMNVLLADEDNPTMEVR